MKRPFCLQAGGFGDFISETCCDEFLYSGGERVGDQDRQRKRFLDGAIGRAPAYHRLRQCDLEPTCGS
jgi:hypothetical protein